MIDLEAGKVFLVAVQEKHKLGDIIEARGIRGRIVEAIGYMDYIEVWAFRGFPSEGLSVYPRYYYRCERLNAQSLAAPVCPVQDSQCAEEV